MHTYPPPKRELQKRKPESIPSTPARGLGAAVQATEVHVHTHSGHALLGGSHTTSLFYPHPEEAGETHITLLLPGLCTISSLSIPRLIWLFLCWILRWAGSCSDNSKKQALSRAVLSHQSVLPLEAHPGLAETSQACSSWSSGSQRHRSTRFRISLGRRSMSRLVLG